MVFVVSCFTQTLCLSWTNAGEAINNLLMFATIVVVIGFPFWTFFLLRRNKDKLNDKEFYAKFWTVYEHLKWKKEPTNWTLLEPCISSFRMLLTICALLYMQNWRTFQIIIAMAFHYFVLIYNGQMQPFHDKTHYFFQQFNEVFVFWTICVLMTFADLITQQYGADTMGWVLIVLVTLNLVINFVYIVGKALKKHCRRFYIKYLLWRRSRLRASLERKHAEWLANQHDKIPMSPRSLKLWHKLSRDLGLQHNPNLIDESNEYSFNSQADLVISKKKNGQSELGRGRSPQQPSLDENDDDLILNRLNRRVGVVSPHVAEPQLVLDNHTEHTFGENNEYENRSEASQEGSQMRKF